MDRDQAIMAIPYLLFSLGFFVIGASFVIAATIRQGAHMKVVFSLGELERASMLDAVKNDPKFWNCFVDWAGDAIKGPPGDPADPKDVALQITGDAPAMGLLKNGLITHCMVQVAEDARVLLQQFREEQERLLEQPVADLQAAQTDLTLLRNDCDSVRTLTAQAAQQHQEIIEATAALRATAVRFEQVIETSDVLKRIFGLPAS